MTERTQSSTTEPTSSTSAHLTERVAALTDRRGVLKVAGVVGAVVGAGALAACSSSSQAAGSSAAPASAGASATSGADPAAGSGGASGGMPTSEIPVGSGKIFPDTKVVVTQPTAGTFKAFDAVCPHQGCTVASFEGSQIVCPCHLSHFDITTGDRVSGPAPSGLTPKTVTVSGDTFTVS